MYKPNQRLLVLRKKFREYYNEYLVKDYEDLEPKRKVYLTSFVIRFTICTIIGAFLFWALKDGLIDGTSKEREGILKTWIIYTCIAIYICSIPIKSYKEDTKALVMNKILSFFGKFDYHSSNYHGKVSGSNIKKSFLFSDFTIQTTDDAFCGKYKDTEITVTEQELTQIKGSGRNRQEITIFSGILILLEFAKQKKYSTPTIVSERRLPLFYCLKNWQLLFYALFFIGFPAIILYFLKLTHAPNVFCCFMLLLSLIPMGILIFCISKFQAPHKKLEKINLEDVVFSKNWSVYGTDQIESRVVINPALMERMLEIKRRFYGKKIEFSFFENKILIAVHTNKDMFETTSLFTQALSYHKVQEVITQFYSIFSAIRLLNTDDVKKSRKPTQKI